MDFWRIKWEKIVSYLLIVFCLGCMVKHIVANGFDINIAFLEFITYTLIIAITYVSLYYARKSYLDK